MSQFYSNNNRDLLSKIHKLNCLLDSVEVFRDDDVIMEYVIEKISRKDFHFSQVLEMDSCSTLSCRLCSNERLVVGQAAFFTAVRCSNCDYEIAIHEG